MVKSKSKGGKSLVQTKDQTPLMSLSGTRKVVRTPTNPLETPVNTEVHVPKEIITQKDSGYLYCRWKFQKKTLLEGFRKSPGGGCLFWCKWFIIESTVTSTNNSFKTVCNFVSRLIVSFVLQDRISCTHNKNLTTDIGNGQSKSGNTRLVTDSFDPQQHRNLKQRGWIGHHQSCWRPCLSVEGRRPGQARFPRISVMERQFLTISPVIATTERLFSFVGLTLASD